MKKLSINSTVKIKLNPGGIEILRKQHEELKKVIPGLGEYTPPKVDKNGYTDMQLWQVMKYLGPHLNVGDIQTPFNTYILLDDHLIQDSDV